MEEEEEEKEEKTTVRSAPGGSDKNRTVVETGLTDPGAMAS